MPHRIRTRKGDIVNTGESFVPGADPCIQQRQPLRRYRKGSIGRALSGTDESPRKKLKHQIAASACAAQTQSNPALCLGYGGPSIADPRTWHNARSNSAAQDNAVNARRPSQGNCTTSSDTGQVGWVRRCVPAIGSYPSHHALVFEQGYGKTCLALRILHKKQFNVRYGCAMAIQHTGGWIWKD
jgi:hypothetical protein